MANKERFHKTIEMLLQKGVIGVYVAFFYSPEFFAKVNQDTTIGETEKEMFNKTIAERKQKILQSPSNEDIDVIHSMEVYSKEINMLFDIYNSFSLTDILVEVFRRLKAEGKSKEALKDELRFIDEKHQKVVNMLLSYVDILWESA